MRRFLLFFNVFFAFIACSEIYGTFGEDFQTWHSTNGAIIDLPMFSAPILNVTMAVGREATLTCAVDNLTSFKVAWLRVDTQTILTIHSHVITKNHRIGVSHTDYRMWYLHIREVRESDKGWYMCQINTDPMKSQMGFLDVVVPPDILDFPTSSDLAEREGSNVTIKCAATGLPNPNITWRRENGEAIPLGNGIEETSVDGETLHISKVTRNHMGAYLCIASNGVPPSVSKRIMLVVNFPPMIWIQNQLIGAYEGMSLTLECNSEAYPKSINYWIRSSNGEIIAQGTKYETSVSSDAYKAVMKLIIKSVSQVDYGAYKCVSRNALGETDGTIKIYPIAYSDEKYPIAKPKMKNKEKNSTEWKNGTTDTLVTEEDYDVDGANNILSFSSYLYISAAFITNFIRLQFSGFFVF